MAGLNRRLLILSVLTLGLILFFYLGLSGQSSDRSGIEFVNKHDRPNDAILTGHAIASKLGNETIKAELGRAAWKLFHTTFAQFPDKPTADESTALKQYIHLFQRLYPCGECARHFGTILDEFPPQVSSRSTAAAWGCHVHNEVNKSLKKELFDCSKIGDFYDCGCAEGDAESDKKKKEEKKKKTDARHVSITSGSEGQSIVRTEVPALPSVRDLDEDIMAGNKLLPENLDGWVKGG